MKDHDSADCVFCRIVAGKLPCVRIVEDDDVLAFLDIGPIVKGHALVIPKAHFESLADIPPDLLDRVMRTAQAVAGAQLAGLKADGVNLHQANGAAAGQVVPHLHVHVVPRFNRDGHHWNWSSTRYADDAEQQATVERIRRAL